MSLGTGEKLTFDGFWAARRIVRKEPSSSSISRKKTNSPNRSSPFLEEVIFAYASQKTKIDHASERRLPKVVGAFGPIFRQSYFGQDHVQTVVEEDRGEVVVKVAVESAQSHVCAVYSKRSAFGR